MDVRVSENCIRNMISNNCKHCSEDKKIVSSDAFYQESEPKYNFSKGGETMKTISKMMSLFVKAKKTRRPHSIMVMGEAAWQCGGECC